MLDMQSRRPGRISPEAAGGLLFVGVLILIAYLANAPKRAAAPPAATSQPTRTLPPQYKRFVHGPVNIRSGPGTQYSVVRQAQRHEPIWVGVADSTGWTAVYKQEGSADTVGFILARLIHMDPRTPAEIEAEEAVMRRAFAQVLERRYLDQGYDIRVKVEGQNSTTLVLQYVLFNRVWAHHFEKEADFWREMRQLGFKRVELTDGFYFSTAWVLN